MQALLKVAQQSGLLQRAGAAALPLVSIRGVAMGVRQARTRPSPAVIEWGDAARPPAGRLSGPTCSRGRVQQLGVPGASG